eukprot:c11361_g1_i1.p1 GENE.c11361_g1_i1~~c11361_g1_i1.p1  ORF type:complete len:185 (+),score=87.28 c11361_g1_i1:24-557(+)
MLTSLRIGLRQFGSRNNQNFLSIPLYSKKYLARVANDNDDNLAAVSGVPDELLALKTVRIHQPGKSSTQSGNPHNDVWVMEWVNKNPAISTKWQNPVMGWTSTADTMSQIKLKFPDKETAIQFAKAQGWGYEVSEPIPDRVYLYHNYVPGGGATGGTRWKGHFSEDEEDLDPRKKRV